MERKFTTNEFYYLFTRGIGKEKIYLDKSDYLRFIHDLYEFNDTKPALGFSRTYNREKIGKKAKNVGNEVPCTGKKRERKSKKDRRDLLVNLHAFVLMPNRHHLLVEQLQENGISLFARKLHGGYSRAFNLKHKRTGHLFQGAFKSIYVKNNMHLGLLICYFHSYSLDLWKPNWQEKKLTDSEIEQALKFLEKYQWSSHRDYLGIKNFSSVISKEFLLEFFDGTKGYKEFFVSWLRHYKRDVKCIEDFIFKK